MSLTLIVGPMFSGKSSALLNILLGGRGKIIVVKHTCDDRTQSRDIDIVTHDGRSFRETLSNAGASFNIVAVSTMRDVEALLPVDEISKVVIGVDEGQFFEDLHMCDRFALSGAAVFVAALSGTYTREPFPSVAALLPKCDEIEVLSSTCECGKPAPFSRRISDETELVVIGGSDKYAPCCRGCFI